MPRDTHQRHTAFGTFGWRCIGAALLAPVLLGGVGCGGGGDSNGSSGGSSSHATALTLGTPSSVSGSAADGLTFTFSEALTTVAGQPGVTYTLHESNNGPAPVTVGSGQDPTTHALFPHMTVRLLDPQGQPVSLPIVAGTQTLTLSPGDTADAALTLNLAYFTEAGRYTATVSADDTGGVTSLTTPLALSAN